AAVRSKLEALTGLSGKVGVAYDSSTLTYTITFDNSLGNVTQLTADGSSLTGTEHDLFLKTGDGDTATHLDLTASVTGTDLNFHAMIGPFGLFIVDGSAALGGILRFHLLTDANKSTDQDHLNLVGFGGGGFTSDLGNIGDFIGADSVCIFPARDPGTIHTGPVALAQANPPIKLGTD